MNKYNETAHARWREKVTLRMAETPKSMILTSPLSVSKIFAPKQEFLRPRRQGERRERHVTFDITVDNVFRVEVLDAFQGLAGDETNLIFRRLDSPN